MHEDMLLCPSFLKLRKGRRAPSTRSNRQGHAGDDARSYQHLKQTVDLSSSRETHLPHWPGIFIRGRIAERLGGGVAQVPHSYCPAATAGRTEVWARRVHRQASDGWREGPAPCGIETQIRHVRLAPYWVVIGSRMCCKTAQGQVSTARDHADQNARASMSQVHILLFAWYPKQERNSLSGT